MKYISIIIIILLAAACSGSRKTTSDNSADSVDQSKKIIQLRVNEEKTIQLPGWASSDPQMGFILSDTLAAKVIHKEILSTYDSTGLRPGDPVVANWVIRGLKPGTTRGKFAGHGYEKNKSEKLRLKNFKIVVTD